MNNLPDNACHDPYSIGYHARVAGMKLGELWGTGWFWKLMNDAEGDAQEKDALLKRGWDAADEEIEEEAKDKREARLIELLVEAGR